MEKSNFKKYVNEWFVNRINTFKELFYVQIHLTLACQNKCLHCYYHEIKDVTKYQIEIGKLKTVILDIARIANEQNLSPVIDYTGGDPLLYPHFWDIIEFTKEQNIEFGLKCNPELLDEVAIKRLKGLGIREISISLDGMEKHHDFLRGKGSFKKTIKKIAELKENDFKIRVHSTLSKFNYNQLPLILNFLFENNFIIDDVTWSRYWTEKNTNEMLSKKEFSSVFINMTNVCEKLYQRDDFYFINKDGSKTPKIMVGFKEHIWYPFFAKLGYIDNDVIEKINTTNNCINCTATKNVYIVDYNFNIYKCRKILASKIGNLSEESLVDVISNKFNTKFLNFNKYSECGSCDYYNGCAGCAAIGLAKNKNINSVDPDCFIEDIKAKKSS